jgi:signal transduction histidine kinase
MTNFTTARLKLTAWYVLIVAVITFAFSGIIYKGVVSDLERGFQMAEFHIRNPNGTFLPRRVALEILGNEFESSKRAFIFRLINMNGIIIAASGIAAYILAGKTLDPLRKAMEEQKRFTADASHELKTPLTAMRTELEVALRSKKLLLKDAKQLLESNLEEVIALQKLSENLVRLTRHSQNHMQFNRLNLKEIVESSVKKVSPMAKAKNIKIKNTVLSNKLNGHKESLEELFVILLDNAIKYSPAKSTVHVSSSSSRNKLTINVKDEGVGIDKKDIPKLFDRFYRADVSRNKSTGGFGLGLSIAKQIVDRHKGSISVKSKLSKGSTFKIVLPL